MKMKGRGGIGKIMKEDFAEAKAFSNHLASVFSFDGNSDFESLSRITVVMRRQ
jgi:hypothetical protein